MPFVEHYAVAPAGDSFVLAHVAGENLHRLPDVLSALEPVFGTPVYLRLAARCTLEPGHAIAELHRAWTGRADELLALGPQDRRVEAPELAALPDTLVHGDFHPGNAFFDGDRAVIFDWSDACVAHPLFDLHLYLHNLGDGASETGSSRRTRQGGAARSTRTRSASCSRSRRRSLAFTRPRATVP